MSAGTIARDLLRRPFAKRAATLSGSSSPKLVHIDELGPDPIASLREIHETLMPSAWLAIYELGPRARKQSRRCLVAARLLHAGFSDLMQETSLIGSLTMGRRYGESAAATASRASVSSI